MESQAVAKMLSTLFYLAAASPAPATRKQGSGGGLELVRED